MRTRLYEKSDRADWDTYVYRHPRSNLYHLSGWKKIIEKSYGHRTYYLIATKNTHQRAKNIQQGEPSTQGESITNPANPINPINLIVGVLPLVHLKHFVFGNSLISIPFFDLGGILADDEYIEKTLLSEAIKLGQDLGVNNIELRHVVPLSWINKTDSTNAITCVTKSHKIRMLLELPESSEILMKSFKSKLRSQIKKPIKQGLTSKVGGMELLNDFYKVFAINMRDLGSPVHSKKLMRNVLEEYPDKTRIVTVYKGDQTLACSLITGFKGTLENPWASALRAYSRMSPNMLLYWTMLEYGCDNGYTCFDFGRSSPGEGTYEFKEQWGAKPVPLYWHHISLDDKPIHLESSEKSKFDKVIRCWQKLPVCVTKLVGPRIRKHIGL
ncbi:MAG: FemAB family XrtA/PEP-CTERM system-associated protein [Candidatus Hodarchaeota archaeon]